MEYRYIIHPNSKQKFDLFSYEGFEILNKYINIVKYGGYQSKRLSYRSSRTYDDVYRIDKSIGRFSS